ncbi:MAG: DUF5615 family PIN-like protein [Verrucomicrobiota bacterium]
MNILLDECVDRRLARDLVGHSVSTVPKMGWAGIKNGALLALAEKEFEAFVTVDRKISVELVEGKRVAREGNLLCRNSCATSVTAPVPFCKPNQIQPARTEESV